MTEYEKVVHLERMSREDLQALIEYPKVFWTSYTPMYVDI
jgi:hypothetical protein